jgi:hypothetical protein
MESFFSVDRRDTSQLLTDFFPVHRPELICTKNSAIFSATNVPEGKNGLKQVLVEIQI